MMNEEDVNMQNEKDGRMVGLSKERMREWQRRGIVM